MKHTAVILNARTMQDCFVLLWKLCSLTIIQIPDYYTMTIYYDGESVYTVSTYSVHSRNNKGPDYARLICYLSETVFPLWKLCSCGNCALVETLLLWKLCSCRTIIQIPDYSTYFSEILYMKGFYTGTKCVQLYCYFFLVVSQLKFVHINQNIPQIYG